MPDSAVLIRLQDVVESPWPNGQGAVREIAQFPAAAEGSGFVWRISVATVRGGERFSALPGVGRLLMPLTDGGLLLTMNGSALSLDRHEVVSFAGEDVVSARVSHGTSLDLNVMTDRRVARARLNAVRVQGRRSYGGGQGYRTALMLLTGSVVAEGQPLAPLDTVLGVSGEEIEVEGDALCALIRIVSI